MGMRILTLQQQLQELGRLRTGYVDTSGRKARPARSETWIVTSHSQDFVKIAAETWGGEPEKWSPQGGGAAQWRVVTEQDTLDAILPPGDPLSQSLELWSKGGCARRCDGMTELLSDKPCLCRAQHGQNFHEQPTGTVCAEFTRLNVFLPQIPDVGIWRVETKSHYAAMEIAGTVDVIKSAVGTGPTIPIRLRIEQRQRKAEGQTKKFPVITVGLRGVNAEQLFHTEISQAAPQAIEAPIQAVTVGSIQIDKDSVRAALEAAESLEELRELWPDAIQAGWQGLARELAAKFERPEDDAGEVWAQVMRAVPDDWTTSQAEEEFESFSKVKVEEATAEQFREYLHHLGMAG
jgi:hypothetical protein